MEETLRIDSEYLNELIDYCGRAACGKILKRFEIIESRDVLKREVKELLYEEYRTFKALLQAHSKGLNITQFKMKTKEKSL